MNPSPRQPLSPPAQAFRFAPRRGTLLTLGWMLLGVCCWSACDEEGEDEASNAITQTDVGTEEEPDGTNAADTEAVPDLEAEGSPTQDTEGADADAPDADAADADAPDADAADAADADAADAADADAADADAPDAAEDAGKAKDGAQTDTKEKPKSRWDTGGPFEAQPADAKWETIHCADATHCTLSAALTLGQAMKLRGRLDGAEKVALTIQNTSSWDGLKFLSLIKDRVEELEVIDSPGLGSLVGLEWMHNLKRLTLRNLPDVHDLVPLAGLSGLTELRIEGIGCAKLAPLAGLTGLKHLSVRMRQRVCAVELSPIEGMVSLEKLTLQTPNLGHVKALTQNQELTDLFVWGRVRDLSPLTRLKKLERLTIQGSPTPDLSAIARMPALRSLTVLASHLWDLTPLKKAKQLRHLSMPEGNALILQHVKVLTQLEGLSLHKAKPRSWAVLKEMPWLRDVDLSYSTFKDLSMLQDFPRLRAFGCAGCRLKKVRSLKRHTDLQELNIAGTSGVGGLNIVKNFKQLTKLTVAERQFSKRALLGLIKRRPDIQQSFGSRRFQPSDALPF